MSKADDLVRASADLAAWPGVGRWLAQVAVDEEVEILDGIVFRTFLGAMPAINDAKLKAENSVMLEIRWRDNWETEGFTIEV